MLERRPAGLGLPTEARRMDIPETGAVRPVSRTAEQAAGRPAAMRRVSQSRPPPAEPEGERDPGRGDAPPEPARGDSGTPVERDEGGAARGRDPEQRAREPGENEADAAAQRDQGRARPRGVQQ